MAIISDILVYVPTNSPKTPIMIITVFRMTIQTFLNPLMYFQYAHNSMMAGNASPSDDKQRAPNNEMNNSKFGIATANKTTKQRKRKLMCDAVSYSQLFKIK